MDKQPIDQKRVESGSNIFSRFIWRQVADDVSSNKEEMSSGSGGRSLETRVDASLEGMASTRSGEYVRDHSSLLSLQPWVFKKESYQNDEEKMKVRGDFSDRSGCGLIGLADAAQAELSPRSIRLGYGPGRSRSSLRSRRAHRYSVRPLTSTGNCLIPQLYNEHFEIEEYVFSSFPSQTAPATRPFVITDGKRIISRSSYDPLAKPFGNGLHKEANGVNSGVMETVIGVPSLPELRKPKQKSSEAQHERLGTPRSQRSHKFSQSQGSPDGMLLFSLGISIGVISTILLNRREVEKLNNSLKDTENLVQDLQEELEMKESLTVKELVNEVCENQALHDSYANIKGPIDSFHNRVPTSYLPAEERDQYDELHLSNAVVNSDSMRKIEAELEAELERLEFNMNSTSLEGRVSALGELDSDLIADIVHGELRAETFASTTRECQADPNGDCSSTSTTHTHNPNYAVSPRELSLRLHEVIQYRLEERIRELEKELQHSQKQVQFMETERVLSQGTFSNSDVGSFNQDSPTVMELDSALAQPLCLNLSGDALDAYDEAYDELMRMTETGETLPSTTNTNKIFYGDGLRPSDQSSIQGMEGGSGNKSSAGVKYFEREPTWDEMFRSRESNDGGESDGGNEYEIDDEEGKMIQQIVEKTRQGSPVVLYAQRMLFSMHE